MYTNRDWIEGLKMIIVHLDVFFVLLILNVAIPNLPPSLEWMGARGPTTVVLK